MKEDYQKALKKLTLFSLSNPVSFNEQDHFHILEKLSSSLGRVFCAIWGEWVSGLCHCNQSPLGTKLGGPLGTKLGVETQPLRVTFGEKINSPNAMIIR